MSDSLTVPFLAMNIAAGLLLTLVFSCLFNMVRNRYLGIWAMAMFFYSTGFVLELLLLGVHSLFLLAGSQVAALTCGLLFWWGASIYAREDLPAYWLLGFVAAAGLAGSAGLFYMPVYLYALLMFALCAAVYILAALKYHRLDKMAGPGKTIAGWGLILWGINVAGYTFLKQLGLFTPWSYFTAAILALVVAFGIMLVYHQETKNDLSNSENRYRMLAENAQDLIYRYRLAPVPGFEYVSPSALAVSGYSPEEFYADAGLFDRLVHLSDRSIFNALNNTSRVFKEPVVLKWVRKDGREVWIEQVDVPVYDDDNRLVAIEGIIRDITGRKQAEKISRLAEERLRNSYRQVMDIIEFLPDPTYVIDSGRKVIAWNKAMEKMTGVSKGQINGKGGHEYSLAFYGIHRPMLIDEVLDDSDEHMASKQKNPGSAQKKTLSLVAEIFAPCLHEGRGAYLWCTASPLFDAGGNLVGAIESLRDITARKEMEKQLKYLNIHDPLTRLFNRTFFEEEISRLESGAYDPLGMIICDVDGLKLINDSLGHKAGDELLIAAAGVLHGTVNANGVAARVGGDEFAVLLRKTTKEAVEETCRLIMQGVDDYNGKSAGISLSVSLGFAVREQPDISLSDLFKEADNNMYREKLHSSQSVRGTIVKSLMKMLETRDNITEGHGERLQELILELARAAGLPDGRLNDLRLFAQFHDIGKVGVPDSILFKPGVLGEDGELAEMRRHCELGFRIAQSVPELVPIADWILKHHEWWDGQGYPLGLRGDSIPLECRILAVVDAYDAMTNDRPYRKALPHWQALMEIKRCSGTQFDPHLVSLFLKLCQAESVARKLFA